MRNTFLLTALAVIPLVFAGGCNCTVAPAPAAVVVAPIYDPVYPYAGPYFYGPSIYVAPVWGWDRGWHRR